MVIKITDQTLRSARRAKHEARRARALNHPLQRGHPYEWLPLWIPYPIAKMLSHLRFIFYQSR